MSKPIRKVRSKHYPQVIEVNLPIRFYWHEEGFDGVSINFSETLKPVTEHQAALCHKIFGALEPAIVNKEKKAGVILEGEVRRTRVPKVFREAFKE